VTDGLKLALLEQGRSVVHRVQAALDKSAALVAAIQAGDDTGKRVNVYLEVGRQLFGPAFVLLPRFQYNNEADILQSHAAEAQLLRHATDELHMTFPADEWLQNVGHVRPKVARWDYVRTLVECLNETTPALHPVQVPYRTDDSWVAVEFPKTRPSVDELGNPVNVPFSIDHDTLSVTVHGDHAFTPGVAHTGLLIDDWTEVIPGRTETTGIGFNFNQPNAMPPQALLLAVPPKVTGHWNWQDLVGILEDTLLRAKLRAVEPAKLDALKKPELGVLLPALLASFSEYDLNVELDYRLNIAAIYQAAPIKMAAARLNP
jgi:hypothetical protein